MNFKELFLEQEALKSRYGRAMTNSPEFRDNHEIFSSRLLKKIIK